MPIPDPGMPPESEINKLFIHLVKELEMPVERQVALFALPIDKKWHMICAKRREDEGAKGATDFPDYYIDSIRRFLPIFMGQGRFFGIF